MEQKERFETIKNQLNSLYPNQDINLELLKGDASFRRYFRLYLDKTGHSTSSLIVMDAPPETEPLQPFLASTIKLKQAHLPVPLIHHQDTELGYLVLDDFGNKDLLSVLSSDNAYALYKKAIDHLKPLQQLPVDKSLPVFDSEQLIKEFGLFEDWYLKKHLQLSGVKLDNVFSYLHDACINQPYVLTHRDYHSRNLMVLDNQDIGILDHQDLMLGPISYDLVSLLKDCYIDWPRQQTHEMIDYFIHNNAVGNPDDFKQSFHLTGVQRHLKAIGIFSRLAHLYDNPSYPKYIPRVLKYVLEIADKEPKLNSLARLIRTI